MNLRQNLTRLLVGAIVLAVQPPLAVAAFGQAGSWAKPAGAMSTPRDAHSVVIVGGKVLIIGGRTEATAHDGGTTTKVDSYAPTNALFSAAGDMATPRSFFPAVSLPDGAVLAPGGFQSHHGTVAVSETFDPLQGTWKRAGRMRSPREQHTATLLPNGSVLVAGGFSNGAILRSAEIYTPSRRRFRGARQMATSRFGHAAALLADGRLFVVGGRTLKDVSLHLTELYDSATNRWAAGPLMVQDRYRHTLTTLRDGRILITGGYSSTQGKTLATGEIYDPATNSFTLLTSIMSDSRMDHTATLLADGHVLIVGGWSSLKSSTVASADIFDPATGLFTPAVPLPISRHEHAAILLPDGSALVTGGLRWEHAIQQTLNDAEIYRP